MPRCRRGQHGEQADRDRRAAVLGQAGGQEQQGCRHPLGGGRAPRSCPSSAAGRLAHRASGDHRGGAPAPRGVGGPRWDGRRTMADRVELVADVSRLGGDLAGLRALLDGPLAGLFGGVHLLSVPLPPDMADAETDARAALDALVRDYDIIVDLPVNDVPAASAPFLDWLEHGGASAFDGMFLTLGSVFPAGVAESDLALLHLPGPGVPFSVYAGADGAARVVWTTFGPRRIDIDVRASAVARAAAPRAGRRRCQWAYDGSGSPTSAMSRSRPAPRRTGCRTRGRSWPRSPAWCRERGLRVTVDLPAIRRCGGRLPLWSTTSRMPSRPGW